MGTLNMDDITSEALECSIRHWEENAAATFPKFASVTEDDCALCRNFIAKGCRGCPVFRKTGERFCVGTPYMSAVRHLRKWRDGDATAGKFFHNEAQAELDFLRSLRAPEQEA
jgi:hypothetical protein